MDLLTLTPQGLYCPPGDFYIDPWRGVERAVVTHAHADHARRGSKSYLTSQAGAHVLKERMGPNATIQTLGYREPLQMNGVQLSFFPAGHILGSSQVRVEHQGEVWVASGDYKTGDDKTCDAIEPVRCHTFLTEATFAMPLFRWRSDAEIFKEVSNWWARNQRDNRTSVVLGYSLGKAQRLLANIDSSIGPIVVHPTIEKMNQAYARSGVQLPATLPATDAVAARVRGKCLVVTPPGSHLPDFGECDQAFLSGWMQLRQRRRSFSTGFVLSDHADWPGLLNTIDATGAERILTNHGYADSLAHWLTSNGKSAEVLQR